eukprot:749086-Hanusia_phi.AAC.4
MDVPSYPVYSFSFPRKAADVLHQQHIALEDRAGLQGVKVGDWAVSRGTCAPGEAVHERCGETLGPSQVKYPGISELCRKYLLVTDMLDGGCSRSPSAKDERMVKTSRTPRGQGIEQVIPGPRV